MLKLRVDDLAVDGGSVGRHEGQVVFVDRGLPGDWITARVTRVKRGFANARLESIETPSERRVTPACPHVPRCGGCRLQELEYEAQCEFKRRQVREVLVRVGGFENPEVAPIRPAPEVFHYRNKMEFSFHPGEDGKAILGLHERGTFDRVFALETCLLPSPLTVEIVHRTQEAARTRDWRAYHPRAHHGVLRYLTVRHLPLTDQCAVHLVAASEDVPGVEEWARGIAALSPAVRSVTLLVNASRANVAFGERERVLVGDGSIIERLLGLEFEATANSFLQTNSRQAEALYRGAIEAAAVGPEDTVLDLYCGTGTLTLAFARAARRSVGVESVPDAVAMARRNAARNGIENAEFHEGESRRVLREWARGERPSPGPVQVVVVDPPRAGLHPRVVARVAELGPRRIVYVSCNPSTLARDARDFAGRGYRLGPVEPYDMFPHTPHVECVAVFDPDPSSP